MTCLTAAVQDKADKAVEQSQGTPWCRDWRQKKIFARFPLLENELLRGYVATFAANGGGTAGNAEGNRWLRKQANRLTLGGFNVTHDSEGLENYAQAKADAVFRIISSAHRHHQQERAATIRARLWDKVTPADTALTGLRFARVTLPTRAEAEGRALTKALEMALHHALDVAPPHEIIKMTAKQRRVLLAKLSTAGWWRRRLRVLGLRRVEQFQRDTKRVHKRAGIYVSNLTFEAYKARRRANDAMLEGTVAVNQFDQEYTLKELASAGVANPDNRHAEVMTRIRDTEVEANRKQHHGVFVTWTLPSRWHAVHASDSTQNAKYQGATPRQAQAQLQALWARVRSKLARDNVATYGIRVVEPHHDGTPHWHLLLWVDPEQVDALKSVLTHYAMSIDPGEVRGKTEKRIRFEDIDPARGSAAGYVLKYVTKNINKSDQYDEVDHYGEALSSTAPRIAAWSSVWGIRQFQFIGLPSVTVWRELRRLRDASDSAFAAASHEQWKGATRPDDDATNLLEALRSAANAGDWDKYLQLTGGAGTGARKRPVRPWTITRLDTSQDAVNRETGEVSDLEKLGQYGESIRAVVGVVVTTGKGDTEFLTRFYRWEVKPGVQRSGEAAKPWTRVSKYTEPDITPPEPLEWDSPEAFAQRNRFKQWRESPETQKEMVDLQAYEHELRESLNRMFTPAPFEDDFEEFFPPELDDSRPQESSEAPQGDKPPVTNEASQALWHTLTSSQALEHRTALGIDDAQALRLAAMYFKPPQKEQAQWVRLMQPSLRALLTLPNGEPLTDDVALSMASALWESPTPRETIS